MKTFTKQPRDHLDYDIDLSEWLDEGDRIQNVEAAFEDGAGSIEIVSVGYTDTRAKVWIRGGNTGMSYKLTALIYTNARVKEVEFLIIVVDF